jgi:hypothetical protein
MHRPRQQGSPAEDDRRLAKDTPRGGRPSVSAESLPSPQGALPRAFAKEP